MKKKKVISKGYTLEIISWENDGDKYRTKFFTVESKEDAIIIYKMCKELFISRSNDEGGVGNTGDSEGFETILNYYNNNKESFSGIDLSDAKDKAEEDDIIIDYFRDIAYDLMGDSEYYDFRVCGSCKVTYSEEDIYLEQILFE